MTVPLAVDSEHLDKSFGSVGDNLRGVGEKLSVLYVDFISFGSLRLLTAGKAHVEKSSLVRDRAQIPG